MLTYATLQDYRDVKAITVDDSTGDATIQNYLRYATRYIERMTHRRFFPYLDIRRYSIPTLFSDLANRSLLHGDLDLEADLLDPLRVQVGSYNTLTSTTETVPSGGITALQTTLTVTDADGADALGNLRFAVGDILQIEQERLWVMEVDTSADTLVVRRGVLDTPAAAHTAGVAINKMALTTLNVGTEIFPLDFNVYPRWGLRIVWPKTWGGAYSGSYNGFRYPSIFVTGMWGFHETYPSGWVDTGMTLSAALPATATSLAVNFGGGLGAGFSSGFDAGYSPVGGLDTVGEARFQAGHMLRIDDEFLAIRKVTTSNRTIDFLRGQNGTHATSHAAGAPVYRWDVPHEIRKACFAIAKMTREADVQVGGRIGVGEVSVGVELSIPKDAAEIVNFYMRAPL